LQLAVEMNNAKYHQTCSKLKLIQLSGKHISYLEFRGQTGQNNVN